jgi:hypothetical protein
MVYKFGYVECTDLFHDLRWPELNAECYEHILGWPGGISELEESESPKLVLSLEHSIEHFIPGQSGILLFDSGHEQPTDG